MSAPLAAVLGIGEELINGQVRDSNGSWLAEKMSRAGFQVRELRQVGDDLSEIIRAVNSLKDSFDLIISTGGLGPTTDDVTRDAVAQATGSPLYENEVSRGRLEDWARKRNRRLGGANLRQAFFPRCAEVIENHVGTADAFRVRLEKEAGGECLLVCLPGVPAEMRALIDDKILPWLEEAFPARVQRYHRSLRLFGLPESEIGERIEALGLSSCISVSYRPQFPEVLVSLSVAAKSEELQNLCDEAFSRVVSALGREFVISEEVNSGLPEIVSRLLRARGITLSLAESCTGGLLADLLVSLPGSSEFFLSSVVSYSLQSKEDFLGVDKSVLALHGPVSEAVAIAMASGIKLRTGSGAALSVTGFAGPTGGTQSAPLGTVWVGLAAGEDRHAFHLFLPWSRDRIRSYSAYFALDSLRRYLMSLPLC
jgi:nicotinamide-nucleotide amidase